MPVTSIAAWALVCRLVQHDVIQDDSSPPESTDVLRCCSDWPPFCPLSVQFLASVTGAAPRSRRHVSGPGSQPCCAVAALELIVAGMDPGTGDSGRREGHGKDICVDHLDRRLRHQKYRKTQASCPDLRWAGVRPPMSERPR